MLTVVEKVIFLQDIEMFRNINTADLVYLAAITEEIEIEAERTLFKEGDVSDSMYMVVEGSVRMLRDASEVMKAGYRDVFGTWALFDDEPRLVRAVTSEPTRLLRIDKEDFIELLADHRHITQGVFKAMVGRLRGLASRFSTQESISE